LTTLSSAEATFVSLFRENFVRNFLHLCQQFLRKNKWLFAKFLKNTNFD
jgi:hypothetical protein